MESQQTQQHEHPQSQTREHLWPKGRSANPSGMTKTRLRTAELFAEYREHHGCDPSASDAARLRAAGVLAAKLERAKGAGTDEDASRMARNLNWLLRSLGLHGPGRVAVQSHPNNAHLVARMETLVETTEDAAHRLDRMITRLNEPKPKLPAASPPSGRDVLKARANE